jgi:succinate dehydrogenase / fumarate reductase iron-sulfur subunit
MPLTDNNEKVKFKIARYNPEKDSKPHFVEYEVPVIEGMNVIEGLFHIKEKIDPTLSFAVSCRMGMCGSCGIVINGVPRLACQTQILQSSANTIELKPLPNHPLIRDLVTDFTYFFEKHRTVKPYIIRRDIEEFEHPTSEYLQLPKDMEKYLQFSYCIKCGLCYSACPTAATDEKFLGPQALSQVYRYMADSRDEGSELRLKSIDSTHGIWRCHFAGACSAVCPKGVDSALAIQLLKREMLLFKFSRYAFVGQSLAKRLIA